MSSFFGLGRRRAIGASAGALIAAGALFAAGFFTASALESDAAEPPPGGPGVPAISVGESSSPRTGVQISPGMPVPAATNVAASYSGKGGAEDAARGGASYGIGLMPAPYCAGDLPAVLSGSTIDLSLAGFQLNLPGSGYVLRSIAVRAEGVCDEQGQPTGESVLVVDSSWLHSATGFEVFVSQRVAPEPLPSVLTPYNGQVWAGGYFYTAWVNAYPVKPADGIGRPMDGPDPRGAEVLREVLSRLAPSVEERCYYVQRKGDWSDLAAMGIGDPRGAIPSGLSEQYVEIVAFTAPPVDCNAPALEGAASFSASFTDSRGGTQVYVSAYPLGPWGQPSYGYLDEGSAYWTTDRYGFNVGGWTSSGPIGREAVERIARAMDPNFSAACFITTRQLNESELAGLGFRAPMAPEGFKVTNSSMTATEAPSGPDCARLPDAQYYPQYNLYWSMEGPERAVIEASAYRYPNAESGPGYIHENGLNWSGADGTQYSVYGYGKTGRSGEIDRDTLIAVARSMDPSLEVSKLQEGPIGIPFEKPVAEPAP